MSGKVAVFVGGEAAVAKFASVWLELGNSIAFVVSQNTTVLHWASEREIKSYQSVNDYLGSAFRPGFDWLFSVAYLEFLPPEFISAAREGAANFHDAPLPRHAGLNSPVWALLAGESEHGITWHLMTDEVDAGDILVDVGVTVSPSETALSLNARCLEAALEGFNELTVQIGNGTLNPRPQVGNYRTLHRRHDVPPAAGRLDFSQPNSRVARFVRALDHGRYYNAVTCPKIEIGGAVIAVSQAEETEGDGTPGTVVGMSDSSITVACGDGAVRLSGLRSMDGAVFNAAAQAGLGDRLTMASHDEASAIDTTMHLAKRGDDIWRAELQKVSPPRLAQVSPADDAPKWITRPFHGPSGTPGVIALALGMVAQRLNDKAAFDLAVRDASAPRLPGYTSDWVPLRHDHTADTLVGQALARAESQLQTLALHPIYCSDLPLRDPEIGGLQTPPLALSLGRAGPLEGTAMTVSLGSDASEVSFDSNRIDPAFADIMIARLEHFVRELSAANLTSQLGKIAPMPDTERTMILETWNQTDRGFDQTGTLHNFFEEQVARDSTRPALEHRGKLLSYGSLNDRANRVAHRLRQMGVGPGVLVGLATHRSPLMVIGALAILKAGGAYLPLDPSYPKERIAQYLKDSEAPIVVTEDALAAEYARFDAATLLIDSDPTIDTGPSSNPGVAVSADDLAYVIFTSGSTGRPKGVMICHRNVSNFFAGMDDRISGADNPGVWLAVTSLSFDISVLELFWTLARGFKVVLHDGEASSVLSSTPKTQKANMDLSLYFWGHTESGKGNRYDLLLDSAKFADAHRFRAVWLPERHFHDFGGSYPNPSVTAAAVAVVTRNLTIRAGSCVAPLHHPARIAEEWAVVDNLSQGRVGLALASGWQPNDFVLRPENRPPANKAALYENVDILRRLWRGEPVSFPAGDGKDCDVVTHPRPVTEDLPLWLTTAGNPDTWRKAGELGMNVLTHLLGQSVAEVEEKIALYHRSLREAGHDPRDFTVTLMLHTFLADSREIAMDVARAPMKSYLGSAMDLVKEHARSFPAFKQRSPVGTEEEIDLGALSERETDELLEHAYQRYFTRSGLFGTVEDGIARVEELRKIGVSEVACLVDFGISADRVLEGLPHLAEMLRRTRISEALADDDHSIASEIRRHGVTHLQCTPSLMRMLAATDETRAALADVKHILLGGEPLSDGLAAIVAEASDARLTNMYGPTETTIWSTSADLASDAPVTIGRPIANTKIYLLDADGAPVPVGARGEIWIGGVGVAKGYLGAEASAQQRFAPSPFGEGRIYQTGDLAEWRADGSLQFVGRNDQQVKLRGHRIELGEIEAVARSHTQVRQAVARLEQHATGEPLIVLFAVLSPGLSTSGLRDSLSRHLPDYMVPTAFVFLDELPLTPNGKIDRNALVFEAASIERPVSTPYVEPQVGTQAVIAQVWRELLDVPKIGAQDDFFELGGDSLSALEASCLISDRLDGKLLSMTEIFQESVLADLATRLDVKDHESADLEDLLGVAPVRKLKAGV